MAALLVCFPLVDARVCTCRLAGSGMRLLNQHVAHAVVAPATFAILVVGRRPAPIGVIHLHRHVAVDKRSVAVVTTAAAAAATCVTPSGPTCRCSPTHAGRVIITINVVVVVVVVVIVVVVAVEAGLCGWACAVPALVARRVVKAFVLRRRLGPPRVHVCAFVEQKKEQTHARVRSVSQRVKLHPLRFQEAEKKAGDK